MANYIGNIPSQGEFKKLDSIASSFDGTTTQFNLNYNSVSQPVGGAEQLIVSLNGVIQEPLTSYTLGIGGSSIVFSSAPQSGDTCHIVLFGGIGQTVTPSDQSVTPEKLSAELKDYYEDEFTANGATTDFTLSREATGVNQLMVSIDGILQPTSAYTVSGTTFTVSPALPDGTNIRVVHMGVKAGVFVPQQNTVGLDEIITSELDSRYYTETEVDATFETIANVALKAPIANPSFTGNVGIGETSPNGTLHVRGANAKIILEGTNNSGTTEHSLKTAGSSEQDFVIQAGSDTLLVQSDYTLFRNTAATSEYARFDNNGNFLVGTQTDSGNGGVSLGGSGQIYASRAGTVQYLNREGSDGTILQFNKDGSPVGSIASMGGDLFVGRSTGGLRLTGNTKIVPKSPAVAGGTSIDGQMDLGDSNDRFKDLYLSGGVYLGGIGAANKLDDYEEGTWTPQLTDDSTIVGGGLVLGTYTKIGRLVHARFTFVNPSTNLGLSGTWRITNLPFAISAQTNEYLGGFVTYNRGISMSGDWMSLWGFWSLNYFQLRSHYMNGSESTAKSGTVPGSMLFSGELIYPTS